MSWYFVANAFQGLTMQNSNRNNPCCSNNNSYNNKQLRNNIQKIISRTAKRCNSNYIAATTANNLDNEELRIEYLQQKVLKLSERMMSRIDHNKIIDQVMKLDTSQKKVFLEQLFKKLNAAR